MTATRTRKPRRPRTPKTTQALVPLGMVTEAHATIGAPWPGWVVTDRPPRYPEEVERPQAAIGDVAAAQAEAAKAVLAARAEEYDRQEEMIRRANRVLVNRYAWFPVPPPQSEPHMQGGCGEGASGVIPLPSSPWLPGGERFDIPVSGGGDGWSQLSRDAEGHMAAFEQAHDEESDGWGRLAPPPDISEHEPGEEYEPPHVSGDGDEPRPELDEAPGPAPENGKVTTPSSTYTLDFPQPDGNGNRSS